MLRARCGKLARLTPAALSEAIVADYAPVRCAAAFAQLRQTGAWLVPTHVTREEEARACDPAYQEPEAC